MTISVITPNPSTRFTTAADVGTELQLTPSELTAETAYIESLIDQASSFIEQYTGRVFRYEEVLETLTSDGSPRLTLSRTPIDINASIVVKFNDSVISSSNYSVEDAEAGFLWMETGWYSTNISIGLIDKYPSRYGRYEWSVQYSAGYKMPDEPNTTLPSSLQRVAIDLVKFWFKNRVMDTSIEREQIGESMIWRGRGGLQSMPKPVIDHLEYWKRPV